MRKFFDCGIDLGTTNSCISVPDPDNTCTIIDNIADRMRVTPSAVWISKSGRTVVGQRAYTCTNPGEVKKEFKRDMGTETIYEFVGSGVKKKPEELSAEVLGSLRRDAVSRTGKEMRDAVITVPAAFNMVQCEATRKAAELAGFNHVILLQEPIAASIAYGAQPNAREQYWLVFDYGGGTLDVSIISTKDGRLDNITSKGDNHMGGKDLDRLLYENVILPRLWPEYDIGDGLDDVNQAKIMQDVERCKIELSSQTKAFFETFTAEDNSGKPIDCAFEVTRDEFESSIKKEIEKSLRIAREALENSCIPEEKMNKIILVGGTTFIPAIRNALQNEFHIELDCTLNPMTVVSEGAALYAASAVVEEESPSDQIEDDCFALDLEYSPVTSEKKTNVIGRIIGADGAISRVKIDCIASETSESALWTSGWCNLLDVKQGIFDVDVNICNYNGINLYRVSVVTSDGSGKRLLNNTFEINYKETSLKLSAPPMPYAIGVLVTDGKDNRVDWIIEKDTKLPVKKTQIYMLNKTLNPSENTECEIKFYEGENTLNPDANDLMRVVHIKSRELNRTLIAGTDVEITINIDESRCVRIEGYVPSFDYELLSETLSSSEENYKNYLLEMEAVEKKLSETRFTLDTLSNAGVDCFELDEELDALEEDYDKYYDLINVANDEVHQYIRRFYDLQTKVIILERESRDERDQDKDACDLARMDQNITGYGSPQQIDTYHKLRKQLDAARNSDSKKYIFRKLDDLENEVVINSFDWLKKTYHGYYDASDAFTDLNKASYWKTEARNAIQRHDTKKLYEALDALWKIRKRSVNQAVSAKIADLRKS